MLGQRDGLKGDKEGDRFMEEIPWLQAQAADGKVLEIRQEERNWGAQNTGLKYTT